MAWQQEEGASSDRATDRRDFLTKLVAFVTSQHVATAAVNAGGSGYTDGDVLTLTHAGAYLDARFVATVAAGAVTGLRILDSGAFSNRLASATVGAGGTGYTDDEIVEVLGGTAREKAKVQVTTSAGVVTSVAVFESGGAYSSAPGLSGAATRGVGPSGFGGDDALTLDLTMTGLVGTTGLALTGGTGTSATVDITLAETGWTVDDDASNSANTNNNSLNSVDDEKIVRLVGDATGFTNKPYVFLLSGSDTDSLDQRYWVQVVHGVAHNPGASIDSQVSTSPGVSATNAPSSSGSYVLFPSNETNDADFWIQADDLHFFVVTNTNPGVSTDSRRYFHMHAGFFDRVGTEFEDPFPALVMASTNDRTLDPSTTSVNITGIGELVYTATSGVCYYFRTESSAWTQVKNGISTSGTEQTRENYIWPVGTGEPADGGNTDPRTVTAFPAGAWGFNGVRRHDRSSAGQILGMVPGTTPKHFLIPLTLMRKNVTGTTGVQYPDSTSRTRGTLRGLFWVHNTDASGNAIVNFAEDEIVDGTTRYKVFHTHTQRERYHYIAVEMTV